MKVGDKLPEMHFTLFTDGNFQEVNIKDSIAGKKVVLMGVPGAFTPTCNAHLESFHDQIQALKDKKIDEIFCVSINDPFVMEAWAKVKNVSGQVTMLADWNGEFSQKIGMTFDASGFFMGTRSLRYNALLEDGIVQELFVEENPGVCEVTHAKTLIEHL